MKPPLDINTRAAELVRQIDAFARRIGLRERMDDGDDVALTRQERRLVAAVGGRPVWTMGELARHVMLAVSTLTAVVDRLVAKRLVERERSEKDRRTVWVRLTPEGRARYERFRRMRLRIARGMLKALDAEEQATFLRLMSKIAQGGLWPQPTRNREQRTANAASGMAAKEPGAACGRRQRGTRSGETRIAAKERKARKA